MINEANPAYHTWLALDAELARRDIRGWIVVLPPGPGAVFAACSLLPAFRRAHAGTHPTVNLVVDTASAGVAELFAPYIDQTLVHPGLSAAILDAVGLLSRFRPGTPFLADPARYADGRLGQFLGHAGVDALDIWRYVLHLPWSADPVAPIVKPEHAEQAVRRFAAAGLPAGRTLVLVPEGRPGVVWPAGHWEALARRAADAGWTVCTAVATGGGPVAGTIPVALPASEAIPFAERAGWCVAASGGAGEVLVGAAVRRTVLHADLAGLKGFTAAGPWPGPEPVDLLLPPDGPAGAFADQILDGVALAEALAIDG